MGHANHVPARRIILEASFVCVQWPRACCDPLPRPVPAHLFVCARLGLPAHAAQTSLIASLLGLEYAVLTLRCVSKRQELQVSLGDGGNPELCSAIRAHGNFAEVRWVARWELVLARAFGACPPRTLRARGSACH